MSGAGQNRFQSFDGVSIDKQAERLLVTTVCNQGLIIDLDREWSGKSEWPISVWSREFKRQNFGVQVLEIDYDIDIFGYQIMGRATKVLGFWAHEISLTSVLVPKLVVNPAYRRQGVASAILQHLLYRRKSDNGQQALRDKPNIPRHRARTEFKIACLMMPCFDDVLGPLAESLGFSRSQVPDEHDPDFTGRHENAAGQKCRFVGQTLGVPDYRVLKDRLKNEIRKPI